MDGRAKAMTARMVKVGDDDKEDGWTGRGDDSEEDGRTGQGNDEEEDGQTGRRDNEEDGLGGRQQG